MSTISSGEKRTMISITQLHSCQGTSKYIYIRQPFIISTGGGQERREIGGGETVGIISLGIVLSLLKPCIGNFANGNPKHGLRSPFVIGLNSCL